MQIRGLNKLTLLDYPEHVAATIFFGHCQFRCPFCQNGPLVLNPAEEPEYSREEILSFLKKRTNVLEGVCITGGEPTLEPELEDFIREIKALSYKVKLDTNGYRPEILKRLADEALIDYVAMDIKSSLPGYEKAAGKPGMDLEKIKESVDFLMHGQLPFEFRTTVVKELHTEQEMREIGQWLAGCPAYFLQVYQDSEGVLEDWCSAPSKDQLEQFVRILKETIPRVEIRGLE